MPSKADGGNEAAGVACWVGFCQREGDLWYFAAWRCDVIA